MIRRRDFIALLGGAAAAWPITARAQQAGKLPTIGFLGPNTAETQSQWTAAFLQRLRELGWIDGRNIAIEYRWLEGRSERATEIAAEFVRLKVDVIVTAGDANVVAARQATSVIPIVFAGTGDPVGSGLVASLARPACQSNSPILLVNNSNFCVKLSLVSAGWRSWPMLAIRAPCRICARFRLRLAHSVSKLSC